MTCKEYKNIMCYDCKFKNCKNDICEKHQDNVKIYKCNDFVSKLEPRKKDWIKSFKW